MWFSGCVKGSGHRFWRSKGCMCILAAYNLKLGRKSLEAFPSVKHDLNFCSGFILTISIISGNCFLNSSRTLKMNKSLVLAAIVAAAALAACGKTEAPAPAPTPAPAAAVTPAPAPAADAHASAASAASAASDAGAAAGAAAATAVDAAKNAASTASAAK